MKTCTQCKARFTGSPTRCPLDGAPLVDLPDPLLGKSIGGRYRIESKIGAGGMASVYRASHDLLGRKVAIKFLSPELSLDETQRKRFLREARATNQIKHEHIVDISDYGEEENGLVYLVMEYLEGEPLAYLIARGPIEVRSATVILLQTARALMRSHEFEVIHRDLKPENIFITRRLGQPHVKLLDFGLAHVRSEARLTALGSVFGTPEYMSPEQARGLQVGPASDLYSLGIVYFEMLTGRLPFEGSTAELILKHLQTPAPSLSSRMPGLPRELDGILHKMLAKDPAQRQRDAHELIEELTAFLLSLPEPDNSLRAALGSTSGAPTPVSGTSPEAIRVLDSVLAGGADDPNRTTGEHPTAVPVSARSWVDRRGVIREAIARAYDRAEMPKWVGDAAGHLEKLVEKAIGLENETQRVARTLAEREEGAAATRERIGRALDELTRDERALGRLLIEMERRSERARTRLQQATTEFAKAWNEAKTAVVADSLRNADEATAVELAGRRASGWRQAFQEAEEADSQLSARRATREDLRFQMSQLKGRLAAMNAEVEHELSSLREKASELSSQMAATQDQLTEATTSLSAHLSEFPAVKPLLSKRLPGAFAAQS